MSIIVFFVKTRIVPSWIAACLRVFQFFEGIRFFAVSETASLRLASEDRAISDVYNAGLS